MSAMPVEPIPIRVALIGGYAAAYRAGYMAQALMSRPSLFIVTARAPSWYRWPRRGKASGLLPLLWAIRAVLNADTVVFTAVFHFNQRYRLLLKLARLLRKRVVVDFYISHFDSSVRERKVVPMGSRAARSMLEGDRAAIRSGTPTLFLSDAERDYYSQLLDVQPLRGNAKKLRLVIPERPLAQLPFVQGQTTSPCVAWWGRLGNPLHGVDVIMEALRGLQETTGGKYRIMFFPSGEPLQVKAFSDQASDIPNCSVNTTAAMENGELLETLRTEVDVALGVFGGTEKARIVPINKVIEAMAMGIPCITGDSAAFNEDVAPGALRFVGHGDTHALAQAVEELVGRPEAMVSQGRKARDQWRALYSPEAFEKAFVDVMGSQR